MSRFTRLLPAWISGPLLLLCPALGVVAQQPEKGLDYYGASLPNGAIARMESGRLRAQPRGNVNELAISPDGKLLVAADYQGVIVLFDPRTAQQLPPLPRPMSGQGPFVFSADGKKLATRDRNERGALLVYDPAKGEELLRYRPDADSRLADYRPYTLSPDGKFLVIAVDANIRFVDVETGKVVRTLDSIGESVYRIRFSPDGKTIAAACKDKSIRLWDIKANKERHQLRGHTGSVWSMVFTRDSTTLLSGDTEGNIYIWDASAGKQLDVLKRPYSVQALDVSADGKYLATGGQGQSVALWDLPARKVLSQTPPHYAPTWSLAFTADGKHLAWGDQSSSVRMATLVDERLRMVAPGNLMIRALAFVDDGKSVITVGDDTIRYWEAATGKEQRHDSEQGNDVLALACTSNHRTLALACSDRIVRLRDAATTKDLFRLDGHERAVRSVGFSADGKFLASAGGASVHLWDVAKGTRIHKITGHKGSVTAVAFGPDGSYFASASEDETVRLWDRATGNEIRQFAEHKNPVTCVAIASSGKLAASGSWDGIVRLWNPATAKEIAKLEGHVDNISVVVFSPQGDLLATASWDSTIRLWNTAGKEVARFDGHNDEVTALAFSADGKRLASGSRDHTVLVWQIPARVFDIGDLIGRRLRDVQSKPKDVDVRLSEPDKARRNKEIHKPAQLERANPVRIQFASFIADHGDLQPVPRLELSDQFDHLGKRLRLCEHEFPELIPCERAVLVENRPAQILLQREFALLVGVEDQVMPILHRSQLQFEVRRRAFASMMVPPIGEQDTADIQKQASDRRVADLVWIVHDFSLEGAAKAPLTIVWASSWMRRR
jgi:WD40 repeat protein